ncbi:rare lipoprotein A [Synechococcus sp. PCC 7502]|nr:rare lipoprotein A [Synechococcus sp. PCC 7502]
MALIAISSLAVVPFNDSANADTPLQSKEPSDFDSSALSSTLKVGETRSESLSRPNTAIAKVFPYQIRNKTAATVYVNNLPVFTFIDTSTPTSEQKVKYPTPRSSAKLPSKNGNLLTYVDPVERATVMASTFNQLARDGFDAKNIVVVWQSGDYVLKLGDQMSLKLDSSLLIPDATKDKANDAIATANLLRRLLGKAQPLTTIAGMPATNIRPSYSLPIAIVSQVISGMASWYGPGFHGGYTANGERFDKYTLTAAHPTLPFGTPVRVTNTYNGKSVVVRINDRGPYSGGRVIDLSQGAAQMIGLISSGVAPVKLEVMGR